MGPCGSQVPKAETDHVRGDFRGGVLGVKGSEGEGGGAGGQVNRLLRLKEDVGVVWRFMKRGKMDSWRKVGEFVPS